MKTDSKNKKEKKLNQYSHLVHKKEIDNFHEAAKINACDFPSHKLQLSKRNTDGSRTSKAKISYEHQSPKQKGPKLRKRENPKLKDAKSPNCILSTSNKLVSQIKKFDFNSSYDQTLYKNTNRYCIPKTSPSRPKMLKKGSSIELFGKGVSNNTPFKDSVISQGRERTNSQLSSKYGNSPHSSIDLRFKNSKKKIKTDNIKFS